MAERSFAVTGKGVICEERSDEAISSLVIDLFSILVIGAKKNKRLLQSLAVTNVFAS